MDVLMKCSKCGKDIVENSKAYGCEGWRDDPKCNMTIFKSFMGTEITRNEAIRLFQGEEIEKEVINKAGDTWKQKLIFNAETGKLDFVKSQGASTYRKEVEISPFNCPACGKSLFRDGYKLNCECGQSFWTKIKGKELSDYQLGKIFGPKHTSDGWIDGFQKTNGMEFAAKVVLEEDDNGKWSLKFDFN